MKIDIEQIKVLLEMVSKADIAELTIEMEDESITIKKPIGLPALPQPDAHHQLVAPAHMAPVSKAGSSAAAATGDSAPEKNNSEKDDHLVAITSPMVGTFYRSSSPTTKPFIEVGDKVAVGQTVCIIEAMKLMNDLPAEISGRLVKICAENGSTVEFGQQLFLIDPKA